VRRAIVLPLAALALAACEEEQILAADPEIHLCPSEDTPTVGCDLPLDLGERAIRTTHPITIVVANRGRAPLSVDEVAVDVDWITVELEPVLLNNGASLELIAEVDPPELGAHTATITVASDDPLRPEASIELRLEGVPKPEPKIEVCLDGSCGSGVASHEVDVGVVRRTQRVAREVIVRNVGEVDLEITDVVIDEQSSSDGEFSVEGSTRAGALAPGGEALLLVSYAPADAVADALVVTFHSNDPTAPELELTVRGASDDNLPPVAVAGEIDTGATAFTAVVGDTVAVDSAGSSDPEGDPLRFEWTLVGPEGSEAVFADPAAGRALFVPDFAGVYTASLIVRDTLGQPSAAASAEIDVSPQAALRVRLRWTTGGDVDLHLVPTGDPLFGATDCYFDQPQPDLGVAADSADDPELRFDDEAPPGAEDVDFVFPADGTYQLYAHYFDAAGSGPADASVSIITFDQSPPTYDATVQLDGDCALWFVGEVTFPGGIFTTGSTTPSVQCPP
jgi:hypothetical protein